MERGKTESPVKFINGCDRQAILALRFLADNKRPCGGEQSFNSEHLFQIAEELEESVKSLES